MSSTDQQRLLAIYLNDQLALSVGWRDLARRALKENRGGPLEAELMPLVSDFTADVRLIERLMTSLGVRRSRVKPAMATAAERLGRLKPNGRLRSYSPLSKLLELDALMLALESKLLLWRGLRDAEIGDLGTDVHTLIERTELRRRSLDLHRAEQATRILGRHS
jgi:hypothetical protein